MRAAILEMLEGSIFLETLKLSTDDKYDYLSSQSKAKEALQYHIGSHSYSRLFLEQMTELHGRNYVTINGGRYPYNTRTIYWRLEDIINDKVSPKQFTHKGSYLAGKNILHVHHSQAFHIERNHIRYLEKRYRNDAEIHERLQQLAAEFPDNDPRAVLLNEALMESVSWDGKTGEWIIYQQSQGRFHFICLATHNCEDSDDKQLYNKIKSHLLPDCHSES